MARYYDLDKLSKLIEAKADTMLEGKGAMLYVAKWLNLLPAADVVEVRHGEWINKNGIYVCSECGHACPYDVVGDVIEYWECLYCRHCGAKMDGGKDVKV